MTRIHTTELKEFYKKSNYRNAVLAWYPFMESDRVLEISDGYYTEYLQKHCGRVASFQSDNLMEIGFSEKYDYVILLDPERITVEVLEVYSRFLSDNGKLLLLFENPFGLPYFAGKRNDRNGRVFSFLDGESKAEVENRLMQAGFRYQRWYYPFPNHYFTKEVYSDDYLPNEFMNHRPSDYIEWDQTKVFDERGMWREVIRNGAFTFLCPSYFVEASKCEESHCGVDFAAVTIYRERERAFATTIHQSGIVRKKAIYKEGIQGLMRMKKVHQHLNNAGVRCIEVHSEDDALVMKRVNLPTMWDWWTESLSRGNLDKETMIVHWDFLKKSIERAGQDGSAYWELGPANCFFDEQKEEYIFFDQEFYWENTSYEIALVRGLWQLMWSDGYSPEFEITKEWLEELKVRYGVADRWSELLKIAKDDTHIYVFNPEGTAPIEKAAPRALEQIRINQEKLLSAK